MNARSLATVSALDRLAAGPQEPVVERVIVADTGSTAAGASTSAQGANSTRLARRSQGPRITLPAWLAVADDPWPVILPVGFALGVIALWELTVRAIDYPAVILPPPSMVAFALFENWPLLLANVAPTAGVAIGGFLLAVVSGIFLASVMTWSQIAREAIYPNIVAFQIVPKVAWAPLFVLWLGIGVEARLGFATFIAVFPIIINMTAGLTGTDPSLLRLCRSLTASKWQTLVYVRFPSALPFLFSSMKISLTLAMIGVIVGEFITSQQGLGFVILTAASRSEADLMLAAVLVLCIMGLAFYGLIELTTCSIRRWFGQ